MPDSGTLRDKYKIPLMRTKKAVKQEDKRFLDKESQKEIDQVRKEHSPESGNLKIFTERSPQAFEIPFQSLGRQNHLEHPQLKEKKLLVKKTK